MPNWFITGGTGFVGEHFLREASKHAGLSVVSLQRRSMGAIGSAEVLWGELHQAAHQKELLNSEYVAWFAADRRHFAPLDHLCNTNVAPLKAACEALQNSTRLKLIIYISSISAQPPSSGINGIFSAHQTTYGISKWMAEQVIMHSGLPHVIIRLPFMYGSRYRNWTHIHFWKMLASLPGIDIVEASGRLSLLHGNDLARLLIERVPAHASQLNGRQLSLTDGVVYPIPTIVRVLRGILQGHDPKETGIRLNLRMAARVLADLLPIASARYWLSVINDETTFVQSLKDGGLCSNFIFIPLADGLRESIER